MSELALDGSIVERDETPSLESLEKAINDDARVLHHCNRSVQWTNQIKDRVQDDGVTRGDMVSLEQIRGTTELYDIVLEPIPALENNPPQAWPEVPMYINMEDALESFTQTISELVGKWIERIGEYSNKILKWLTQYVESHNENFEKTREAMKARHRLFIDYQHKFCDVVGMDHPKASVIQRVNENHVDDILTDSDLKRNRVQIAAFVKGEDRRLIDKVMGELDPMTESVRSFIDQVTEVFAGDLDGESVKRNIVSDLNKLKQRAYHDLIDESSDDSLIVDEVTPTVLSEDDPYCFTSQMVDPNPYLKAYKAIVTQVEKLNLTSAKEGQTDTIRQCLEDLGDVLSAYWKLIVFVIEVNHAKLSACKVIVQYQTYLTSAYYDAAIDYVDDEEKGQKLQELHDQLKDQLKD